MSWLFQDSLHGVCPPRPLKDDQQRATSMIQRLNHQQKALQEINISHLGKRKIIFKYALSGGYVNSLEGKPITIPRQRAAPGLGCHCGKPRGDLQIHGCRRLWKAPFWKSGFSTGEKKGLIIIRRMTICVWNLWYVIYTSFIWLVWISISCFFAHCMNSDMNTEKSLPSHFQVHQGPFLLTNDMSSCCMASNGPIK